MASIETEWQRVKQIELDGIEYQITVIPIFDGMFRASWVCPTCDEKGAWEPLSGDPVQAIEMAKVALRMHHTILHRRGPHAMPS